jgi:cation transport ATPase
VEDWDEEETHAPFRWPWKRGEETEKAKAPLADLPAKQLAAIYGNGLVQRKRHLIAAFVLCALLAYVNLTDSLNLPIFRYFWDDHALALLGLELLGVILVLLLRPFVEGIRDLLQGEPGMHTLASVSVLITVVDSVTFLVVERDGPLPCVAASGLILCCSAWGQYLNLSAQRISCRTAAMTDHPSRLNRQEEGGVGTRLLLKEEGDGTGFGSQIQEPDGIRRMTGWFVPVVLVAAAVLSVLAASGSQRMDLLLWDASVIFTLAAPLAATIAYGIPYRKIAGRLNRSGAVIAGWDGVRALNSTDQIMVTDNDLFPTGMVTCNGLKTYGNVAEETVVGYTATLIRAAGCGLEKTFANLVYTQGAKYWMDDLVEFHVLEGGGYCGRIRKDEVIVGTADFMKLMQVELPQGISVKTAAFCAINGNLAAQFALIYQMPAYVEPSMKFMIKSKLTPVMGVRDFNLTPQLLENTYSLSMEKVEFPDMDTRLTLADSERSETLGALLGREGVDAHCDTVIGAKRLYKAAKKNGRWLMVASVLGLLLGFYLTYSLAFTALQPVNLLLFLLFWSVPALLNAYPVDRY